MEPKKCLDCGSFVLESIVEDNGTYDPINAVFFIAELLPADQGQNVIERWRVINSDVQSGKITHEQWDQRIGAIIDEYICTDCTKHRNTENI